MTILAAIIIATSIFYLILMFIFKPSVFTLDEIPSRQLILIPGAGLRYDGKPTHILEDRLITVYKYLKMYSADNVLLSGSTRNSGYNEPSAMLDYLVDKGIHENLLTLDILGNSTFHSLNNIRALHINDRIIIISQRFHLTRALLIARLLRIDCIGLVSNNISFSYHKNIYWYFREILSTPYNLGRILIHIIFNFTRKNIDII